MNRHQFRALLLKHTRAPKAISDYQLSLRSDVRALCAKSPEGSIYRWLRGASRVPGWVGPYINLIKST